MKISNDDVKHVAELARLEFKEDDLDRFARQLENILDYMEKLNELNTSSVEPTSHVLQMSTPLREDVVYPWLSSEEALENAPEKEEGFFTVPKIIED